MSNNKQSSVGLLITILGNYDEELLFLFREQIKQAKAMHKEEMIDALLFGDVLSLNTAENYYKVKFGGNK